MDSHDTERILNVVEGNDGIVKLAYVFLLTFPGSPCIYYGSEIGMGGGEHSNRQCMIWEENRQNRSLFTVIHKLINLRKEQESFKTADFSWITLTSDMDTVMYKKITSKETLYVLLHNEERPEVFNLPKELIGLKGIDYMSGSMVTLEEKIELGPYDYRLYKVEKNSEE